MPPFTTHKTISNLTNHLAEFRFAANISQSTIAYHIGISRQAYQQIEKGLVNPSLVTALKLAIYLETSVEKLFDLNWWPSKDFQPFPPRS